MEFLRSKAKRDFLLLIIAASLLVIFIRFFSGDSFAYLSAVLIFIVIPLRILSYVLDKKYRKPMSDPNDFEIEGLSEGRIYSPSTSVVPKALSIFPFFISIVGFCAGFINNSIVGFIFGIIFLTVGVCTFSAKSIRYVDLNKGKVVKEKKWMMFKWGESIPLAQYDKVSIVTYLGSSCSSEEGSMSSSIPSYHVNLIGKYASSDAVGFDINMNLAIFFGEENSEKARKFSEKVSEIIGVMYVSKEYF